MAVPVVVNLSTAAPPTAPNEKVITAAMLDPGASQVTIAVTGAAASQVFTVQGLQPTYADYAGLSVADYRLTFEGAFPVGIAVAAMTSMPAPLQVEFDTVTIDKPASGAPFGLNSVSNVYLTLTGSSTLTAAVSSDPQPSVAGLRAPAGSQITVTSQTGGALTATGNHASAGIGGQFAEAAGTIVIGGNAIVTATGGQGAGALSGDGAAGIGGGRAQGFTAITITDSAVVNATGGNGGAGIGAATVNGGDNSGSITISGSAAVNAQGGFQAAGIGGGMGVAGGAIVITDTAKVVAVGGDNGGGIGSGYHGGMGQITISGEPWIFARSTVAASAIGGAGSYGAQPTDFVRITGSPLVVAHGANGGIGGGPQGAGSEILGSVEITGGFIAAASSATMNTRYAIGSVTGGVVISGGSVFTSPVGRGSSGVQDPVNADGVRVFPLYIPAYEGGVDFTGLALTADPFPYGQNTITQVQRDWIAALGPAQTWYPLPDMSGTISDADKLAATLWAPESYFKSKTLESTIGFAADITDTAADPVGQYGPDLKLNVLRRLVVSVDSATANGVANALTSTELAITFDQEVPGLAGAGITVEPGTASVVTDPAGLSSTDGITWTMPLTSVSAEGTVALTQVALPSAFALYTLTGLPKQVPVHKALFPALTPVEGVRIDFSSGSATFASDQAGEYYFAVTLPGDPPPSAAEVFQGNPIPMTVGDNTISLTGFDSNDGRVVYVVAENTFHNRTIEPITIMVGPMWNLSVQAGAGGSAEATASTYPEGAEATLTATPADYYEFDHWTVEAGGTEAILAGAADATTTLTMPGNDVTVKANFVKKNLKVNFELNKPPAATENPAGWPAEGSAKIGEQITGQPTPPSLARFTFVGWYLGSQAVDTANPADAWNFTSGIVQPGMITNDTVTLYGAWASAFSTITYDLHATIEEPVAPAILGPDIDVAMGSLISAAPSYNQTLTRAGYTFGGWFFDAARTQPVTATSTVDSPAITLHARWLTNGDAAYSIRHYKVAGGVATEVEQDREPGQGRIGTLTPAAQPNEYVGYVHDVAASTYQGTITSDGGLVLALYYNAKDIAVVFDADGGVPEPGTIIGYHYDGLVAAPTVPGKTDHTFLGWYNAAGEEWDFGVTRLTEANGVVLSSGAGRLELTAKWAPPPGPVLTPVEGRRIDLTSGTATFTSDQVGTYYFAVQLLGTPAPSADQVVAGGRSGVLGAAVIGNTIILGAADLDSNGARVVYVVGENAYGVRSAEPIAITVGPVWGLTVLASEGGSAGSPAATYPQGALAGLEAEPSDYYRFDRWTVESGGSISLLAAPGSAETTLTMPGGDVTVKAWFVKKGLDVEFVLNEPSGTGPFAGWPVSVPGSAVIGGLVAAPTTAVPALVSFDFVGWYTSAQAVGADPAAAWDFAEDVVVSAPGDKVTLYGGWAWAWAEVGYELHGSTEYPVTPASLGPDQVRMDRPVSSAASYSTVPQRASYRFTGWAFDAGCTQPVGDLVVPGSRTVTLHACWAELENAFYQVRHHKVAGGTVSEVEADRESYQGRIGTLTPPAEPNEYAGYVHDAGASTYQGTITSDDGLVLGLYYNANDVAVVFDAAGGSPEPGTVTGHYDGLVAAPTAPAKTDHAFLGWYNAAGTQWDFTTFRLTEANGVVLSGTAGQLELTARWARGPEAVGVDVTVGTAGVADLAGTALADSANGAAIVSAVVTTTETWIAQALIAPQTDGTVHFEARTLPRGSYQFTVEYTDSNDLTARAHFKVTVAGLPSAAGDTTDRIPVGGETSFDLTVTGDVPIVGAEEIDVPSGATVTATPDGQVDFDSGSLPPGEYHFSVVYTDELGQTSEPVEFVVTVQAPPTGTGQDFELADDLTTGYATPLLDTTGTNLQPLTDASFTTPAHGVIELDGPVLVYTPEVGWAGEVPFEVTVCDDLGQCTVLQYSFTIPVVRLPVLAPVAEGDSAVIPLGGVAELAGTVSPDSAGGATIVSAEVVTDAAWVASAAITPGLEGAVRFEAQALPAGVYEFTVRYTDSNGSTADAVFTVTVQGPPRAAADVVRAKVRLNGQLSFTESVTSTYGWIAERVIVAAPDQGVATLGSVHYDATGAAPGEHPFDVRYIDDLGQSTTVRYIPLVQAPPQGTGRDVEIDDDRTVVVFEVLDDVTGTELQPLAPGSVTAPDHGTATLNGSAVSYTPQAGWRGKATFGVTVCDDLAQCATLGYSVTISPSAPASSAPATPTGATPSASGSALPFTGSDALAWLGGPALALIVGGLLLVVCATAARRRLAAVGRHGR
jgi:uncharacterized repeat protein (TIGR02543 family)